MSNLIQNGIQKIYPLLEREIKHLCDINKGCTPTVEKKVLPITTDMSGSVPYFSTTYHPQLNCIFFIPAAQVSISKWHYYNITEDKMYEYATNLSGLPTFGFLRGIYDYKQNRIILCHWNPYGSKIYFIDTSSMPPKIVEQTTVVSISSTVTGGIYDDINNKIYWSNNSETTSDLYYSDISQQQITNGVITLPSAIGHTSNFISCRDKNGWFYSFSYSGSTIYRFKPNNNLISANDIQVLDITSSAQTWINLSYIPHLNAIFYGDSTKYIDCSDFTVKNVSSVYSTSYGSRNALNNKVYIFSSYKLYEIDLTTMTASEGFNNSDFGLLYQHHVTDKNGDIFYFNFSNGYTGNFTFYKLNMNLKVKPSTDLLLSGIINNQ